MCKSSPVHILSKTSGLGRLKAVCFTMSILDIKEQKKGGWGMTYRLVSVGMGKGEPTNCHI